MKTLYIPEAPEQIACFYCGEPCTKWHQDMRLYPTLDYSKSDRWEYHCYNHKDLEIEVTCVQHKKESPNWFFNRIAVIHKNLRLHWNFYSGDWASLEQRHRTKEGYLSCWEPISKRTWPPTFERHPAQFLFQSDKRLRAFLKLYAMFS